MSCTIKTVSVTEQYVMVTPYEMLKKAQEGHYAVAQLNMSTLEIVQANVNAAKELNAPLILGTSEGERAHFGVKEAVAVTRVLREELGLPIFLNADHTKSFAGIKEAVDAGYDMVHLDGSALSYAENIALTKQSRDYAKSVNPDIVVEGELGAIVGGSELHKEEAVISAANLTNPEQVADFMARTGVDSLAVSIGNIHGVFGAHEENPHLHLDLLQQIAVQTKAFLVLHGGSGTPPADVQTAVRDGIVKVNINTELRLAYAHTLRETLNANPDQTTPYKIFPPVVAAVQAVAKEKISLFGSANKA